MTAEQLKRNNAAQNPSTGAGDIMRPATNVDRWGSAKNYSNAIPLGTQAPTTQAPATQAPTGGAAATPTTPTTSTAPTTGIDRINQMYDAQKEANRLQLESAYNQNMSDAQAARDKIAPQYQGAANDLAVQFERARRNMNTQAMGSGINSGAATQMGLSQTNEYLRDFGKLRSEESNAVAEADRNMLNLKTQYQSAIQAAAADNDYRRAAALLDEYNNQTNRDMQKAQLLAQYGDFSMYANLYGQDVADNMFAIWKAQNPDLAYNTGRITADEYRAMTGKYPKGYKKPSGGGRYYGGDGNGDGGDGGGGGVTPPDGLRDRVDYGKMYETSMGGYRGSYDPDEYKEYLNFIKS